MEPAKPSQELLRALTDEHVLRALMRQPRLTRAELAAATGVSKPTAGESVRRLVAAGLVADTGQRTAGGRGRGRVGAYYALADTVGLALAVSIAPEGIVAECIDPHGAVMSRAEQTVTRPARPEAVAAGLRAAATQAIAQARASDRTQVADGVAAAGGAAAADQALPAGATPTARTVGAAGAESTNATATEAAGVADTSGVTVTIEIPEIPGTDGTGVAAGAAGADGAAEVAGVVARGPVRLAVVSAADPVDRATGRMVHLPDSPFLLGDLDPVAVLAPLVAGPVIVDNDVNWAARAERDHHVTGASALDDFAYVYLGEGLGCAIISDGEVRRGHGGLAGEIAHLLVAGPDGQATSLIDVFGQLGLRQPNATAVDTARLLTATTTPGSQAVPGSASPAVPGPASPAFPGSASPAFPGSASPAFPGSASQAVPGSASQAVPGSASQAVPGSASQATATATDSASPAASGSASPAASGSASPAASGSASPAVPGSASPANVTLQAVARAVAGAIAAIVALADPAEIVLGGPWGSHPVLAAAIAEAAAALPRPVPVRAAAAATEPALSGARADALARLRAAIVSRAQPARPH